MTKSCFLLDSSAESALVKGEIAVMTSRVIVLLTVLVLSGSCKNSERRIEPSSSRPAPTVQPTPSIAASQSGTTNTTGTARTDACRLLTGADIESVQHEPVKDTKLNGSTASGFSVSQCFFTLATFTNSISLQITQKGEGSSGRDPKEFWTTTFHHNRQSEKEREQTSKKDKEKEEEGSAPPQKITGVGDEAYWMGSRVGGALYILKGSSYLRISVGGAGTQEDKIKKSKALAQKAITRL
ncbi:MAG: hypothetical protein ABR555_05835 [Pyrinomonadaceae bacterium]